MVLCKKIFQELFNFISFILGHVPSHFIFKITPVHLCVCSHFVFKSTPVDFCALWFQSLVLALDMSEYKAMAEGKADHITAEGKADLTMAEGKADHADSKTLTSGTVETREGESSSTSTPTTTTTTTITATSTAHILDPTAAATVPTTVQSTLEHSSMEKKEVEPVSILPPQQPESIIGAVRDPSGSSAKGEQPMEVDEGSVLGTVVSGDSGGGKSGEAVEVRESKVVVSAAVMVSGETEAMETEEGAGEKTEAKPEIKLKPQTDSRQTDTICGMDPDVPVSVSEKVEGERGSWVKTTPSTADATVAGLGGSALPPSTPPSVKPAVTDESTGVGSSAATTRGSAIYSAVSPASDHVSSAVSSVSTALSQNVAHTPAASGLVTEAVGQGAGRASTSPLPLAVPAPNATSSERTSTALPVDSRESVSPILAAAVASGSAGVYATAGSSVPTSVVSQVSGPVDPASTQTESGTAASEIKMEESHLESSAFASAVSTTTSVKQQCVLSSDDRNVEKGSVGTVARVPLPLNQVSMGVEVVSSATSMTPMVSRSSPKPTVVQMSTPAVSAVSVSAISLSAQPVPPSLGSQSHPTPSALAHISVSTVASSPASASDSHPSPAHVTVVSSGSSSTSASTPVTAHAPASVSGGSSLPIHTSTSSTAPLAASSSSILAPGRPSTSPNLPKFRFTTITSKEVQALLQDCLPTTPLLSTPAPSYYSASLLEQNKQAQAQSVLQAPSTSFTPSSTASAQLQSLAHLANLTNSVTQTDGEVVAASGQLPVEQTPEAGPNPRLSPSNQRQSPVTSTPISAEGWLQIIIIIITYIYNALNDAVSASRIHSKLKTILSKYIHIQNRQS